MATCEADLEAAPSLLKGRIQNMRIARSTGVISGVVIALLGIWAGLSPFVGPYFGYEFGSGTTWHFTTDRLWLSVLPGALAIVAGGLLVISAMRSTGALGGLVATLAGGWLAVGPAVSLTWESGVGPIGRPLHGTTRQMVELVGSFYGVGALIVAFGAFAIGRFASRPRVADPTARTETQADVPAHAETVRSGPARRRRVGLGSLSDRRQRRRAMRGRGEDAGDGGEREVRRTSE
jgi:hypothetical protein